MAQTATSARAFKSLVAKACREKEEHDAVKEMLETLKKIMNNKEFSDVVFVCNDGVSLYASRVWLRARSLLFLQGLAPVVEEVSLEDVSSSVLSVVLEFVYTGSVESYKSHVVEDEMERWVKGLEVIRAARFFVLPGLEDLIWNSLIIDVHNSSLDKDLTNTSTRLSTLQSLTSQHDGASGEQSVEKIITLELIRILDRGWLGMPNVKTLSQEALLFLLESTQNRATTVEDDILSLREYLRLRQVLMWCVAERLDLESAGSSLEECLPAAASAYHMIKGDTAQESLHEPSKQTDPFRTLIKEHIPSCFKSKILPTIDLIRIHPILLVKILEPLKIFSGARTLEALRYHATKRVFSCNLWEYVWTPKGCFRIPDHGNVSEKSAGPSGTIVISSPAFWQDRTYEWDIVLHEWQTQTLSRKRLECQWEVGMLMNDLSSFDYEELSSNVLSSLRGGWALKWSQEGSILVKQPNTEEGKPILWKPFGAVPAAHKDSKSSGIRINVRLNMIERTCSFSWNEVSLGKVWVNLPPKYYFPAVSFIWPHLSPEETASVVDLPRARVELIEGFEIHGQPARKRQRSPSPKSSGSVVVL